MAKKNNSYSMIDAGRLFYSYCIVAIHTSVFSDVSQTFHTIVMRYITSFAVPFFMICSGYFLGVKLWGTSDLESYRGVLKKYIKRLLYPYVFWGVLYFVIGVIVDIKGGTESSAALISHLHMWAVSSPGGGLWYIQSILLMCAILYYIGKDKITVFLGVLAFSFFVPSIVSELGMHLSTVSLIRDVYNMIFIDTQNFVFRGLHFLLGIILASEKYRERDYSPILGFVVSYSCFVLLDLFGSGSLLKILTQFISVLCSLSIFSLLKNNISVFSDERNLAFRKTSSIIYFTHFTAIYFAKIVCALLNIEFYDYCTVAWVFCCIVLSIWAILIIKCKSLDRVLKRIY